MDAIEFLLAGEQRPLYGDVKAPQGQTLTISTQPTYTLYSGTTPVTGHNAANVTGYDTDPAQTVRAWVNLATSGLAAGPYTLVFSLPVLGPDAITRIVRPRVALEVVPVAGILKPYLLRVREWLRDQVPGEEVDHLTYHHWRDALREAVQAYSRVYPRVIRSAVTLTAGVWEYAYTTLTAGITPAAVWAPGFSEIVSLNPRYDATIQTVFREDSYSGYSWDDERNVWRFTRRSPSAGDVADVRWKTIHTLSESVDSLPSDGTQATHIGPLTQYAAGMLLLGPLANEASGTNEPQQEMAVVSYRDITARRAAQGKAWIEQAQRGWRRLQWNF